MTVKCAVNLSNAEEQEQEVLYALNVNKMPKNKEQNFTKLKLKTCKKRYYDKADHTKKHCNVKYLDKCDMCQIREEENYYESRYKRSNLNPDVVLDLYL